MPEETVLLEIKGGVAVVTLNRPAKLNAFAGDMRDQLNARLDDVAARAGVRVLVLTGAGRAFCAGGDIDHMTELSDRGAPFGDLAPLLEAGEGVMRRLAAIPFPVIAALNGVAAGAGANLALACDVRLASDAARLGETFVKIGLHPDWAGTYHLTRLVGAAKALDLCWTGELVDAAEALRLGLVQRVWPAADFEREWRAYAQHLADGPQVAIRATKASLKAAPARTLQECLAAERDAQEACWTSPDAAEGVRAFAGKRPPRFSAGAVAAGADAAPARAARLFE
jgi:2-(1,2-epoxy-1,2-dihydrophenyl)acetyl-CoA isomerase